MGIKANIFNIQHFSVHDGPGVRTVVFFKGCSLHCRWCHNPESIHAAKEILLYPDRCIGCMACREVCPVGAQVFDETGHWIDRSRCIHCFKCCEECYADALVSVGEWRDTDSILKDCQAAGVHTAVDTAGNVPWESFEQVLPYTDLFLYDIKAMDSEVHKACTGVENGRILENFTRLADRDANIFVRYPYIPGMNDDQVEKIAEFLHRWQQIEAELLPYHKLGNSKYRALEAQNVFEGTVPLKDEVEMLKKKYGFQ